MDEFQQAAVDNPNNQLLITAGPGSGKTTVLTRRLAKIISENIHLPQNCLAITFTRKAAQEMKTRLQIILKEDAKNINIHTFHSLCFSILKEQYEAAGLNKDFQVMSEQEKELCTDKSSLENILNFDQLINLTVKLLEENPEIQQLYRKRFKYTSVDEYQDIDENQYKLIRLLVPENGNICVIGDPNQAIYGFRGGDSKFFKNFTQDYKNAQPISLKNNYRSTGNIVDASNQMIESFNIVSMYEKPHERITIHTAPTDKSEAEFIASTIENLIGGHNLFSIDSSRTAGQESELSFSDFAILYRTSSQLPQIIEALVRTGMPYVTVSNEPLCSKKPVHELLNRLTDGKNLIEQIKDLSKEFADKIDNNTMNFLLDTARNFETKTDFIHEISMSTEADTLDKRADRITLMTLHSSKGLEFKCVFIAGLEDGILPLYRAKEEKEIEEERRLLYVGMTRAEERLFLTRAIKRKWLGTYKNLEISPFLEKIEQNLLELSKFEQKQKEENNTQQLSLF